MSEPRVMVALPSTGSMKVRCAACLAALTRKAGATVATIRTIEGCYIHRNRERFLDMALKTEGLTHMLFVDSDMAFPEDGLERLLAADKDIIGANYNMRVLTEAGGRKTAVRFTPEHLKALEVDGQPRWPKEPFQVRAVPTGFMLIRLEAVRELPRPWFDFEGDVLGAYTGEDVFFCDKAREHGVEVWCDPTIPVGHIGDYIY